MFDPYKKWLGIQPKDQPPNHYRLLSLDNFETDLDVIEGAADRQMGFIRQYQSGEHAIFAAKLLNEIATARLCLLKPASKAEYDAKLRKKVFAPETTKDDFAPFESDDEMVELMKGPKIERKKKRKKSKSPQGLTIAGGVGAVAVILIIALAVSSGHRPSEITSEANGGGVADSTPSSPTIPPLPPTISSSPTTPAPTMAQSPVTTPSPTNLTPPEMAQVEKQSPTEMAEDLSPEPNRMEAKPARPKTKKSRKKTIEASDIVGGSGGIPFKKELNGKAMTGVICTFGSWAGSNAIASIEPISQGSPGKDGERFVAPKGYAIGGINICAPKLVSHVQLIFMAVNEDGTLDPSKTKLSKWIGGKPRGEVIEISGEGKKVVGLTGRSALVVDALGLLFESEPEE